VHAPDYRFQETGALWAANNGGALLKTLRDKEQGGS